MLGHQLFREQQNGFSASSPDSKVLKAVYDRNDGASSRSATVAVSVDGLSVSKEVVFTQEIAPVLSISSQDVTIANDAVSFSADAQSFDVLVSATSGSWSALSSVAWLDVTVDMQGGKMGVRCRSNLSGSVRSGTLTISIDKTDVEYVLSVSQSFPVLTVSGKELSYDRSGGSKTLSVSSTGVPWKASLSKPSDWLSLRSDVSTGLLSVTVQENELTSPRKVVIVISLPGTSPVVQEEVSVRQTGNVSFQIEGSSAISLTADSGDTTLTVIARDESAGEALSNWTVSEVPDVAWITSVTKGVSGGSVTVSYSENSGSSRSATLTFSLPSPMEASFNVVLSQSSPTLALRYVSPSADGLSVSATSTGYSVQLSPFYIGSLSFAVSHTGPSWTASTGSLPSTLVYNSSDALGFGLTSTQSLSRSSGVLTLSIPGAGVAREVSFIQEGPPAFALSPPSPEVFSAETGSQVLEVALTNVDSRSFSWALSQENRLPSWLEVDARSSSVTVRCVSENTTGASRKSSFRIVSADDSSMGHTVSVSQASNVLTVSPSLSAIEVWDLSGESMLEVSTVIGDWVASERPAVEWLSVTPSSDGSRLTILYDSNPSASSRTAVIRISVREEPSLYKDVTLTQSGHAPYITLSSAASLSPGGGQESVSLSVATAKIEKVVGSVSTWSYAVTESVSWVEDASVSVSSGNTSLVFTLSPNLTDASRSGSLRVTLSGHSEIYSDVTITQRATPILTIAPAPGDEVSVGYTSGSLTYTVSSSDVSFSSFSATVPDGVRATFSGATLTIDYPSVSEPMDKSFTVSVHLDSSPATIRVSKDIVISQSGKPTIRLSESSLSVSYEAGKVKIGSEAGPSGLTWTVARADSKDTWIRSFKKVNNDTEIEISYDENTTGSDRSGGLTVSHTSDAVSTQTFTLHQGRKPSLQLLSDGVALSLSSEIILEHTSGDTTLSVNADPSDHTWSLKRGTTLGSWLSSVSRSKDGSSLTVDYYQNTTLTTRKETVLLSIDDTPVSPYSLVFSQKARPQLSVSSVNLDLKADAIDTLLEIVAGGGSWTATTEADWISPSKESASSLKLSIDSNVGSRRTETVLVSIAEVSLSVSIDVLQRSPFLEVDPGSADV